MNLIRVQVATTAVVSRLFTVNEDPTDAVGSVTVTVKRLDGTVVDTETAGHPSTGLYTYPFVSPATDRLDTFTVDWSGTFGGAAVVVRDVVEIVGGFIFELGEARARLGDQVSRNKVSTQALADRRTGVEFEAERVAGHAFVPRFRRVKVGAPPAQHLALPDVYVRAVRAVTTGGVAWAQPQLDQIELSEDAGVLYAVAGWGCRRGQPVIVEYEHGWDGVDVGVRDVAIRRLKDHLGMMSSQIPANALSFTVSEGGVYRLSQPGVSSTGDRAVDAVYLAGAYSGPV